MYRHCSFTILELCKIKIINWSEDFFLYLKHMTCVVMQLFPQISTLICTLIDNTTGKHIVCSSVLLNNIVNVEYLIQKQQYDRGLNISSITFWKQKFLFVNIVRSPVHTLRQTLSCFHKLVCYPDEKFFLLVNREGFTFSCDIRRPNNNA